ncbi:MAG: cysteine desulfurase [Candidatus Peregrinibacteria bacterium]
MGFKRDFPIFKNRPELIYFDNAATAQKPRAVLEAERTFYETHNSNIHRGPNFLAEEATVAYESARKTVAKFVGAAHYHEIIFTRNSTEAINLVARSFVESLKKGDEILLTKLEHHSNIVPWLQLKERRGVSVRFLDVTSEGEIVMNESTFTRKTKLLAITGMSNALGVIPNLRPFIKAAHAVDAKVLVDASQLAVHQPIDVQALDCDFLVFTGHKLYGSTGIGVLYGKEALLKAMPPFLGGGDMIEEVFTDHFTPASLPNKFEAGTPNIAGAIGLKAAIEYVEKIGRDVIHRTESDLTEYLLKKLKALPYLTLIGPQCHPRESGNPDSRLRGNDISKRGPIVSFTMKGVHPHDVAEGLSQKQICIRGGHHCCQPLMDEFKIPGTARISLAFYNTTKEIDRCAEVLREVFAYFT